LYDIAKKMSGLLVCVTYAVLLGSTVFVTYSVAARYFFKKPVLGSVEIVELAMSAMVFAGLAFTQTQKGHVHITMLVRILPKSLGHLLFAVCSLLSTALSGAAAYACFLQGRYAADIHMLTMMVGIPYAPFYYFASVCMCVLTIALLLDTAIAFMAVAGKDCADFVRRAW
jgi:TRAP-type C4-dicarboxylate transport system permease small subunit